MPHWSCSSALCFNNNKSLDENGEKVRRYRLPADPNVRKEYVRMFKFTESFDWENGFICGAHWTSGVRETTQHLPDNVLPLAHYEILKEKFNRAKTTFQAAKKPTAQQRSTYQLAMKRFNAAESIMRAKKVVPRPPPKKRNIASSSSQALPPPQPMNEQIAEPTLNQPRTLQQQLIDHLRKELFKKDTIIADLNSKVAERDVTITVLNSVVAKRDATIAELSSVVAEKSKKINELNIASHEKTTFSFEQVGSIPAKFLYLTGLSLQQFGVIWGCINPYIEHCLKYGDRNASEKTFSFRTQYLIVLMICRHGLDFRFVSYMCDVSETTIGRIFNGWIVFLAALFNQLDQRPDQKYLQQMMPEIFTRTGHGMTDLVLDATEFKFQTASNFDISSLMFSHYKNTTTGKALIGISAHGMGIIFSEIYPGSISDTEITEKTDILNYVQEGHEIMTDRGFAIQDLCAIKGVSLNRPKQKDADSSVFLPGEIHRNFDIAATRIHVERYIGRVRNWRILNNVWPLSQVDMLTSTWQVICHTVNILFPPIGPKTEGAENSK